MQNGRNEDAMKFFKEALTSDNGKSGEMKRLKAIAIPRREGGT